EGALKLDTLVVAAAGNDGPAGPGYGSIGGPGGAPAALTVGAADLRDRVAEVRVVAHAGLSVELDTVVPLAGNVVPRTPVDSPVGAPRLPNGVNGRTGSVPLEGFFDARGRGLVADRAALVPVGADPASTYANAARAGATAVLFYGGALPGGALGAAGSAKVPAVSLPVNVAERLLERLRAGVPVTVSVGSQGEQSNDGDGHVAEFSSTGLAFDGRVKPELVAPGVAVGTAEPTAATDGSPRYGVVNGTNAAAALVATPTAGHAIRVPWVITFGPRPRAPLAAVHLSAHAFAPSDTKPALLSFVAGAVPRSGAAQDVRPLSRVDLELWSPTGGQIG